jgi:hypothetical protein
VLATFTARTWPVFTQLRMVGMLTLKMAAARHVNPVSDEHRQPGTDGTVLLFSGAHLPRMIFHPVSSRARISQDAVHLDRVHHRTFWTPVCAPYWVSIIGARGGIALLRLTEPTFVPARSRRGGLFARP